MCHAQKSAATQSGGQSQQHHTQPLSQAAGLPSTAVLAPTQAVRQQRKPQTGSHSLRQPPRQQANFDQWLNDPHPQLNRSISPPVPLDPYAEPPMLPPNFHAPFFLHPSIRDGRDVGYQQGQSQLQQQPPFRRPLPPSQQQQRPGSVPRHQPPPPRSSSADNLQRHATLPDTSFGPKAAGSSTGLAQPGAVQQPDAAPDQGGQRSNSPQGWMQEQNAFPGLPGTPGPGAPSTGAVTGAPASFDSPPMLQGIWGNGLHQQRLVKLANDLSTVKITPPSTTADAAAAATASGLPGRERAPLSTRSAGSTPHAREGGSQGRASFDVREGAPQDRGHSSLDGRANVQKRRQRMPHNASAQELGQNGGSNDGGVKRDPPPKLSLDSLTSQRQAEAAHRQQALANFDLKTEDFPALGGMPAATSLSALPLSATYRATPDKAWSEADASTTISPPPATSSVKK